MTKIIYFSFVLISLFYQQSWGEIKCSGIFHEGPVLGKLRDEGFVDVYHMEFGNGYLSSRGTESKIKFNQNSINGHSEDNVNLSVVAMILPEAYETPYLGLIKNMPTLISGKKHILFGLFNDGDLLVFDASNNNPHKVTAADVINGIYELAPLHLKVHNEIVFSYGKYREKSAKIIELDKTSAKVAFWKQANHANAPRPFEEKYVIEWIPISSIQTVKSSSGPQN